MRQELSGSGYAAGTRIDSLRSRAELGSLLSRYGAHDFVILEHDLNATIRFALHGKYVQYVLPLPDPEGPAFTHTPKGRPRALAAQERVYEQAVRQQWRRAVLVMKGKLEAVECGLSSFEREFYGAIADERSDRPPALLLRRRLRWAPETMLVLLCAGVLVPAGGAVALGVPAVAVERLAAPALGNEPDPLGASEEKASAPTGHALRLATGGYEASGPARSVRTTNIGSVASEGDEPGETTDAPSVPSGEDADSPAGEEGSPEVVTSARESAAAGGPDGAEATVNGEQDEQPKGEKPKGEKPKGEKPKGGKPKGEKPKGGKPGKPKTESGGQKQAKPKKDSKGEKKQGEPKTDSNTADAGQAAQNDAGSNQGAGKDKDKSKGAEKGGKGAGGATSGKK